MIYVRKRKYDYEQFYFRLDRTARFVFVSIVLERLELFVFDVEDDKKLGLPVTYNFRLKDNYEDHSLYLSNINTNQRWIYVTNTLQ